MQKKCDDFYFPSDFFGENFIFETYSNAVSFGKFIQFLDGDVWQIVLVNL